MASDVFLGFVPGLGFTFSRELVMIVSWYCIELLSCLRLSELPQNSGNVRQSRVPALRRFMPYGK
jgi:hypothetical protein